MFFVFAKTSTKQTYQIYVGPGFNPDTTNGDLHAVRAVLTSRPVNGLTNTEWPAAWKVDYNNATACANNMVGGSIDLNCGILQITIDMKDQADLDLKPKNGLCLPSTFCQSADGATGEGPCGGNPAMKTDPSVLANPSLWDEIDRTCKVWAVRDVDYPPAGPLGFSFKMPNDPDGMSLAHRPSPTIFPTTPDTGKPDWATQFDSTATSPDKKGGSGLCSYAKLLTNQSPVPADKCAMPTTAEGGIVN